ncbi:MAG: ABC transporter ATP-binding protein, partial [Clostridiaceae bacterium]|nr:ABC transporter ATP-binding protein [Clostridiaceae bacterium]
MMKLKKLDETKNNIELIFKGIKLIYKLQKSIIPFSFLECLFTAIQPFINIYMSALILNDILCKSDFYILLQDIIVTVVLNFIIHILINVIEQVNEVKIGYYQEQVDMLLSFKSLEMDYEHIENVKVKELRDEILQTCNMNGGGLLNLLIILKGLFTNLVTIILSVVISFELFLAKSNSSVGGFQGFIQSNISSLFFIIIMLVIIGVSIHVSKIQEIKEFKIFDGFIFINKLFSFYTNYTDSYQTGKDIRIFNQKALLSKEISEFSKNVNIKFEELGNSSGKYNALTSFLSSLLGALVYIFIALKSIVGVISIGDFVKYSGSVSQFILGLSQFMNSLVKLETNNQYLKLYFDYLEIKDLKYEGTLPVEKRNDNKYEIEFKNVSFKYPATDKFILKNLSLKFKIGEHLAIVGMTGSGKTTFIKLLCRLYD